MRLLEMDSRSRVPRTMMWLLDRLRPFMRCYTRAPDGEMPAHDLVWVDLIGVYGGGPGQTILEAIEAHPELWAHALPPECCIVPRAMLAKLLGTDAAEALTTQGESIVVNHASRARHERAARDLSH